MSDKNNHWSEETVIEDDETRIICIINRKNVEPPQYSVRIARRIGPADADKLSSFLPVFVRNGRCVSITHTVDRLLDRAEFYIEQQMSKWRRDAG